MCGCVDGCYGLESSQSVEWRYHPSSSSSLSLWLVWLALTEALYLVPRLIKQAAGMFCILY